MKKLGSAWLLPLLILFYSMNFMDRSVLSIVGDALKADLGLSDGQLGLIHSVLLIMMIFIIIPGSACCDLFGRRRMIGLAAYLWTGAMALTGTATGFAQLVFARCLGSVNDAFTGAGGTSWLSATYPVDKRGKIIGLFQMSMPLGMSLGMLFGGVALALTGSWRLSFFIFIVPGIACAILIPLLPDKKTDLPQNYWKSLFGLLNKRTLIICGIGGGFYSIAKFAYQTWLPVLLMRSYEGLSPVAAGAISGTFLLVGAIGPIVSGRFSDWFNLRSPSGRVYAIVICLACMTASKFVLYSLIGHASLAVIVVYGLFDGVLTMMPLPIYFTMVQDIAPNEVRGGACGLMGAILFLSGGAWGPLLVGFFSDLFGGGASGLRLAELMLLVFPLVGVLVFACGTFFYAKERTAV